MPINTYHMRRSISVSRLWVSKRSMHVGIIASYTVEIKNDMQKQLVDLEVVTYMGKQL